MADAQMPLAVDGMPVPPPAPEPRRFTERDMLDRLNVRYGKTVSNGPWVGPKFMRAEHVPLGLSFNRRRIADFIAADMHSQSWAPTGAKALSYLDRRDQSIWLPAPVLHGHEVKVSRSDWLTELRDPEKSEAFRRHMHFWWLVVSDKTIVRDDLPEGWGLMVADGHTTRVLVQAVPNREPEPLPHSMLGALLRASVSTETRLALAAAEERAS